MKEVSTILDDIKLELSATLNAAEYMLWIDGLTPVCCSTTDIVVCAPSSNARDTLEANYAFKFLDAASKAGYPINNVHFITEDEKSLSTTRLPLRRKSPSNRPSIKNIILLSPATRSIISSWAKVTALPS